jgi:putative PIN family toxin of toxin-antitoxin system
MLVVLDTSVLIAAAISPTGDCAKLLQYAIEGRIEIAMSPKLYYELESRLMRDKFRRWLTIEDVEAYVEAIAELATWFDDRPDNELAQICRDPDDEFVIALCQDSNASMLVSIDKDILAVEYPNIFVSDIKGAHTAIEYQHEWGDLFVPGNMADSLRQIEAEGSAGMITAYCTFSNFVNERAVDLLPFVVVPETLATFVSEFDDIHGMLQNRGLGTRPLFASPEVAYLKLPPNPGDHIRVTAETVLPEDTILATMQHCPDLVDAPGCEFANWRVFGIGGAWPLDQIPPRP